MGGSVKIKNRSECLCDGQEAQLHATNHGAACQTVVKSGVLRCNLSSGSYKRLGLHSSPDA